MSHYDFTTVTKWNAIPGWFSLEAAIAIQQGVKRLSPGSQVVELGSYQGRSSVAIAAVLPADGVLHCVDHFQGSAEHLRVNLDVSNLLAAFQKNIEDFEVSDKIRVLAMTTTEAAEKFTPESIDMLLVDAAHDYDSVKTDLVNWYPKLKPGGFLVCDDYAPAWPGVMRAIKAVGLEGKLVAPNLWFHKKPYEKTDTVLE